MIGYKQIYHPASKERVKEQLYKYSSATHPEIFEDLVLTGCHSVLVDYFVDQEQRAKTFEVLGYLYMTDDKYRLPACVDENAEVYDPPGEYTIYHFALENEKLLYELWRFCQWTISGNHFQKIHERIIQNDAFSIISPRFYFKKYIFIYKNI